MISNLPSRLAALLTALSLVLATAPLPAAPSKEQCLDAHSKGQDAREQGKLVLARELFVTCAQSSCPSLVQADCARYAEEVERLVPAVSFGARDSKGADVDGVSVYLDGVQIATRIDPGKTYPIDPGRHAVRFVGPNGREVTMPISLSTGEKGRPIIATFPEATSAPAAASPAASAPSPAGPKPSPSPEPPASSGRSSGPLVLAGVGGAALVAGGVLMAIGLSSVPSACKFSSRECTAAPGDPVFDDASRSVKLANVGIGVGIGGAVLLTSGLVWYFTQSPSGEKVGLSPWLGPGTTGAGLRGAF